MTFQETSLLANDEILDKILSKKTKDSIIQSQIDHQFIQKQFYESPNEKNLSKIHDKRV